MKHALETLDAKARAEKDWMLPECSNGRISCRKEEVDSLCDAVFVPEGEPSSCERVGGEEVVEDDPCESSSALPSAAFFSSSACASITVARPCDGLRINVSGSCEYPTVHTRVRTQD